ncbi:hypothetical protein [Nostoc sphaeroides]|uniref:Uncharacterized protein n=1 Tax=Nostoc sphaeroides CCNUC1 TaxID=2653204 RepID=A0A5P8W974_9NOSO|nr:hypothetical protein [Nostoc sphaeroides]QFS49102.1 hypothetical protein GXM_06596 [Nostoc sphaeroides CCNUC1]
MTVDGYQSSVISYQSSVISHQSSVITHQSSVISHLLRYHSLARLVKGGNSCFDNDVNWMSAATPK